MNIEDDEIASLYGEDRKSFRKERKIKQKMDRSGFKKTDLKRELTPKAPRKGEERGRILAVSGNEISVYINKEIRPCFVRGTLKQKKGLQKQLVTVGDFVYVNQDGHITFVEKRNSILSRSDNLRRNKEQLIAANIDKLLITVSVSSPPLKVSLIDRYVIAAKRGNLIPVILINKIDLPHDELLVKELRSIYKGLGISLITISAETKEGFNELLEEMKGFASVFSGQSGVGKTTLLNFITGLDLRTAEVIEKTNKGQHTTTRATLIPISEDTFSIDTPGIKSFALWDITEAEILDYFSDLQKISGGCKFNSCSHIHEPGCGVLKALSEAKISKERYQAYLSIRGEGDEDQKNKRSRNP